MLDLEVLLTPISEDAPSGADLRMLDTTFDDLMENARELAPDEDINEGTGKEADWNAIRRTSREALTHRSKDLQLAAWLTLGLLQEKGIPGLIDGLSFTGELIRRFWDTLHPGLEEDGSLDLEYRGQPVGWLDQMLSGSTSRTGALKLVPLVPRGGGERALTWNDRELAATVDKYAETDPEHYRELLEEGQVSTELWTTAVSAADLSTLRSCAEQLADLLSALDAFREICVEAFGEEDAPGLFVTGSLASDIQEYFAARTGDLAGAGVEGEQEGVASGSAGPMGSRAAAIGRLGEAAEYFRRAEPHSPVSLLIQRAIRWANMPFEELVRDYIKDETAQGQIWETLGISRDPEQE